MNESLFDMLHGQLLATQAALRAVILASPDPIETTAHVSTQLEKLISAALPSESTDALLLGVEQAKKAILPTKQDQLSARQ